MKKLFLVITLLLAGYSQLFADCGNPDITCYPNEGNPIIKKNVSGAPCYATGGWLGLNCEPHYSAAADYCLHCPKTWLEGTTTRTLNNILVKCGSDSKTIHCP